MANGFDHKTKDGDHLRGWRSSEGNFWLAADDGSETTILVCNRSDLTAIIEKLTALRDGVGQ